MNIFTIPTPAQGAHNRPTSAASVITACNPFKVLATLRLAVRVVVLAVAVVLGMQVGWGQTVTVTYSTSGNQIWVAPPGVTSITVKAWGGGGGGGNTGGNGGRGCGGGGAFASSDITVVPGTIYNISVGAAGTAGNDGGNSSFGTTIVVAEGGKGSTGVTGGQGGLAANSTGTNKHNGGSGGDGSSSNNTGGGGGGGSAYENTAGNSGNASSGGTGGAGGVGTGNGGAGGNNGVNGVTGTAPGGGGGGKGNNATGASGAVGRVVLSYNCSGIDLSNLSLANTAVCQNTTATITVTSTTLTQVNHQAYYLLSGANTTATPQLVTLTHISGNTFSFPVTGLTNGGATTVTLATVGCGTTSSTNNTATITVNTIPAITGMSASVCSATGFTVTPVNVTNGVVPAGTTYTWSAPTVTGGMTGGASGTNATNITGTLTNNTSSPQTATYTVTPATVNCTGSPFTVTITVNPRPAITAIPTTTCSTVPFSVTPADGVNGVVPSGTTYSWVAPTVTGGITGGAAGTNQTNVFGTLTNPTNTAQTATYTVTNTAGSCSGTSFTVTVTVNPRPTVSNMTTTTCSEGTGFSVTPANGTNGVVPTGTTYSWGVPSVNGGMTGGSTGSGASSITGILSNPTNTAQTATYTVTPLSGTCTGNNFTVTATINPRPAITNMTATTCSGSAFTLTPANVTNGIVPASTTYTWSAPTVTGGMTGGAAGTNAANISGTLTNPTSSPQTATYTVTPATASCTGATFTVTITVNPRPAISNITSSTCSTVGFNVNPTDGTNGVVPAGTTYTWGLPSVPGGLTGGATGSGASSITGTLNNSTINALNATYTVTPTSGSCSGPNFTVTVTVNPRPSVNNMTATTCSDGSGFSVTPVNVTNGLIPGGTTYSWSAPSVTGGMTGGVSGSGATSITGTLSNPTNTAQTATYTVTPLTGSCAGNTFTVTATINPRPAINNLAATRCSGIGFTVNPVNATDGIVPAGTTYSWPAPTVTGGMTGGASGNGASNISGTLTNTTNAAQTATYSVTPTSGTCVGSTFTVTVTINPLPQGSISANGPFCNSGTGTLTWTATSGTGPYTIVYNDGVADRTANNVTSGTAFNVFSSTVTSTTTYTLVSVTDANGCVRNSGFTGGSATIIVHPLPQGSLLPSGPYCGGSTGATLTFQSTSGTGPFIVQYTDGTNTYTQNNVTSLTPFAAGNNPLSTGTTVTTYNYTLLSVTDANGCVRTTGFTGATAQIVVNPLPNGTLTAQTASFCGPGTGTARLVFTATAGTGPFEIDYLENGTPRTRTGVVSGTPFDAFSNPIASTTTYTLVAIRDANLCARTTGFGSPSAATITVHPLPQGTLTPNGPLCNTGTQIGTLTFNATEGTGPFNIVYRIGSTDYPVNGINSGATFNVAVNPVTTTTYTLISITDANCTRTTGFTGGGTATITVNPLPQGSLTANGPFCATGAGTLTWTSSTGPGPFTIVYNDGVANRTANNVGSGVPFAVFTTPVTATTTYTLVSVTQDATGCARNSLFTQGAATITVNPLPTLSSATTASVCSELPFTYTATGAVGGTTFSWTRAVVTGISNGVGSGGANNPTINETLVNTTTAPVNVTYIFSMTANGCTNTQNLVVTVNPKPTLSSSLTPAAICSSTGPANNFIYSATSATTGATFSWTRAGVAGINGGAGGSGSSGSIAEVLTNSTANPIVVTYAITITANGCSNTQNVPVTVNPAPTLSSPTTVNRCNNTSGTYTATSATSGASFAWTRAAVAGISNAAVTTPVNSATITETLNNTTANPIDVTYVITISANGCSNPQNVVVTVNPTLNLSSTLMPPAICSGNTFSYTPTSNTTGASFDWSRAVVSGISNPAGSGTGNPNEALTNTTTAPINVTYIYTIGINGCTNTNNVVVSVAPQPVGPTLNVQTPNVGTVCAGTTVSATFNDGFGGLSCTDDYIWFRDGLNQGAYSPGTPVGIGATSSITIQGRRANTCQAGCTGTPYVTLATWNVVPQPVAPTLNTRLPAGTDVCTGSTVSATFNAGTGGNGCTDIYEISLNNGNPGTWIPYVQGSNVPVGAAGTTVRLRAMRGSCAGLSGCTATAWQELAVWNVVAQPVGPTVNAKTPNLASVCTGQGVSATFNAGSGGAGCADDYILIIDGGTPVAYTPGSTVGTFATSTIVIQGRRASCTTDAGCSGTNYVTLADWTVTPAPVSPTLATRTPAATSVCAGTGVSATFNAGSGGTGCTDIHEFRIDGGTWSTYTPGNTIGVAATTSIEIRVSRGGCTAGAGCTSSAWVTVATWAVTPAPTGPALNTKTPNVTAVCAGTTVSATFNGGSGGLNCSDEFQVSLNGGSTWASYTPGASINTTSATQVIIQGRRANCDAGTLCNATAWVDLATWTVNAIPSISVHPSLTTQNVCVGAATTALSVSAIPGSGSITYQWYSNTTNSNVGGTLISGATGSSYTPQNTTAGTFYYYVVVGNSNGCSVTSNVSGAVTIRNCFDALVTGALISVNCTGPAVWFNAKGNISGTSNLNGANLGIFEKGQNRLVLRGGEIRTTKESGANVCGATLHYITYLAGNRPTNPTFNTINLPFLENCGSGSFASGGSCATGGQKWNQLAASIQLDNPDPGSYVLEIYFSANGSHNSNSACNGDIVLDNNNGNNYLATFTVINNPAYGVPGEFGSAAYIQDCSNTQFYNTTGFCENLIGSKEFTGNNFGTYIQNSGQLVLKGGEVKTYNDVFTNVCGVNMKYRVYLQGDVPGSFNTIPLSLFATCNTGVFTDGKGACSGLDKKYQVVGETINLTTVATPGTYVLEVYYEISGSRSAPDQCNEIIYVNNGGTNYSATFVIAPPLQISYSGPFCTTNSNPQAVTFTGSLAYTGGNYTASPAGLSINAATGAITASTSTGDSYTVTYTAPSVSSCPQATATTNVVITPLPTAAISYAGPFCRSDAAPKSPTLTGTHAYTVGTYSSTPGLTIDLASGNITPSTSDAGTYTVTYTLVAAGGCSQVTATTTVTITDVPTATISYAGSPFCSNLTSGPATLNGTGAFTGGTYSAPGAVSINSSTGAINPSASTPGGPYTITYTTPAANGCPGFPYTTAVTITPQPTITTFNYTGTPFCSSDAGLKAPTLGGTNAYMGGTYSSTGGLSINATTGEINPSTSTPGNYVVTYSTPAGAGCAPVQATANVSVTLLPTASLSYAGTPYCTNVATAQAPTLTGTGAYTGGSYSSSPAGLSINAGGAGAITPSTSTPGTYTVTYTIDAANGCALVTATASVTITALPTASIGYAGTPYCNSLTDPQPVTLTGTTGGSYSISPAGLSINAGTGAITPSTSTGDSYTVTYTIGAANGCGQVTATAPVVVTPLPVATFSYAGSPYCQNAANPSPTFSGGGVAGTFSSTAGLVFVSTTTGQINLAASTPGTYTVTNTINSAGGCPVVVATANITITANVTPSVTIAAGGSTCPSIPFTVTATPTNGGTAPTYQWQVWNGTAWNNVGTNSPTYTTGALAAGNRVRVIMTSNAVCPNPTTATSNEITVNTPPGTPTTPTNNGSQCESVGVTLTRVNPPGGVTWYWQTSATGIDISNSAATWVVYASGTYYLRALDNTTGCWSTSSASVTATVNSTPAPPGDPTPTQPSPQCGSITIQRNGSPLTGNITWYWQTVPNGTSTTSNSTSNYVINTPGTHTIYIRAVNNSNCWSVGSGSVTVVVNPLPPTPTGAIGDTRCGTGSVTVSATPGIGQSIDWYTAPSGGTLLQTGGNSYTASISGTTPFYAQARDNLTGCVSAARLAVTATVNPLPTVSLTVGAGSSNICSGTSTNITVANSQSGVSYQLRNNLTNELVGSPVNGTGVATPINLPTGNLTTATTFNVLATVTATGCSAQLTATATISITPLPTLTNAELISAPVTCPGTPVTIRLTGLPASTTNTISYTVNGSPFTATGVTSDGTGTATFTTGNLTTAANTLVVTGVTRTGFTPSCTGNFNMTVPLIVADNTPPTITCRADTILYITSGCSATGITLLAPTVSDNCTLTPTVTKNFGGAALTGLIFPVGITPITWTASDGNGNTSSCVQNVTVVKGVVLAAYGFNSQTVGGSPAPASISPDYVAAGVTSTLTFSPSLRNSSNIANTGIATGPTAFYSNTQTTPALFSNYKDPTEPIYTQFSLLGVSGYRNYYMYFQYNRPNSSGVNTISLEYSTDGTNFTLVTSPLIPVPSTNSFVWEPVLVDITSITGLNNQPNVYIRLSRPENNGNPQLNLDNIQFMGQTEDIIDAAVAQSNVLCNGGSTGQITINNTSQSGVTWEYSINGGATWQLSNIFPNLVADTFDVIMREFGNNQCVVALNRNLIITQPPVPLDTLSVAVTNALCTGSASGSATAVATGGNNSSYAYSWNTTPVQNTATATGLTPGTYNVTITDANNCQVTRPVTIGISPASATLTASAVNITPCTPITLTVNVTGGAGPYNFSGTLSDASTFSGTGPGSATINLVPGATTAYSITSLTITPGPCTVNAPDPLLGSPVTVTVTPGAAGLWTGNVSTNWFECGNWASGTIPTNTTDVTIPASPVRPCVLNAGTGECRDITIGSSFTISGGGILDVYGNWLDNAPASFVTTNGTVRFSGGAAQTLSTSAGPESFYNLTINKAASTQVTFNRPVNVTNTFDLVNGLAGTTLTNLLTITNTATGAVTGGGSNTSYVNGPMARLVAAASAYAFPVGKSSGVPYVNFRPVVVTPTSVTPSTFQVEYMTGTAPDIGSRASYIAGIINTEYWNVDRTAGTADARVVLRYINPNNDLHWTSVGPGGTINNVAVVKRYGAPGTYTWYFTDGPTGTGGSFGPTEAIIWYFTPDGEPVSSLVLNTFSPFGFGHADYTILPIRLLTFTGEPKNGNGLLKWTVANNAEVKGFVVEYSSDGSNYKPVGNVNAGNSDQYEFTHVRLTPGNNYYRLQMLGKDGTKLYSKVVLIPYGRLITTIVGVQPTLVHDYTQLTVVSARPQTVQVRLMDMRGRLIRTEKAQLQPGSQVVPVMLRGLAAGMYNLHVLTEDGAQGNFKVMKE